jgi:amphi-Trp domain-containing protein
MSDTVTTPPTWTDEARDQMLAILADADTAELKLTVPDSDRRSTVVALGLDPLVADMVQVFFFDTPDLRLNQSGLIARARRSRARDDATVKLRPVVPSDLPDKLRARSGFGVEIDAMPGGFVCSGRLKEKLKPGTVQRARLRGKSPRTLFSKQQIAFFEQHTPGVSLDDLEWLGPITVLKLKFVPGGLDRSMVAELWMYPDGSRILELSTKCEPSAAFDVAAETRTYLLERGINVTGVQQTKTKVALEYFAQELKGPEPDDEADDDEDDEETASNDDHRDVERSYSTADSVAKLRRLADAMEQEKAFRIQIAGERIVVPDHARFSIEHERDSDSEEIEFQFTWSRGGDDEDESDGDDESLDEV